jgi:hypothetical protein
MRLGLVFVIASVTACSSGNLKTPDAGIPVADMSVPFPTATMIAPAVSSSSCLAIDGTRLYWSDFANNTRSIQSVALAGGTPSPIAPGGDKYGCVAVDGNGVYYVDNGAIMKAPLTGAAAGTTLVSGQHLLKSTIAVAGGYVYWVTDVYGNLDMYSGKNAIVRVSTSGGNVQVVSDTVAGSPGGLAVDTTNVYYTDKSGSFIRALANPTTATPFGMAALNPGALAVGSGHLALSEASAPGMGDVAVFRTDGMARTLVSTSLGTPLAVDDKGVYLELGGQLTRLALDGSAQTPLAAQAPRAVALSPTQVYFTDGATLWSVPR